MKWREYLFIATLGIASLIYSCNNRRVEVQGYVQFTDASVVSQSEKPQIGWLNGAKASSKADTLVGYALNDIMAQGAKYDSRTLTALCNVMSDGSDFVDSERAQGVIDDVLDTKKPVGKLWLPYAGPKVPPVPSADEQARLTVLYAQNKRYNRLIRALIDENRDGSESLDEQLKAAYKVLNE
jgi:hypothetical protein